MALCGDKVEIGGFQGAPLNVRARVDDDDDDDDDVNNNKSFATP